MTWVPAIPIHLLHPVAPPRLAGIGRQDTVSALVPDGLTGRSTLLFNPFAAVPSLYVGFGLSLSPSRSRSPLTAFRLIGFQTGRGSRR